MPLPSHLLISADSARRWFKSAWWTPLRVDTALAAGLFAAQVLLMRAEPAWSGHTGGWLTLWTAVTLLPVVLRRRWLWGAVGFLLLTLVAGWVEPLVWTGQGVTLWVLAYTLAAYERWWRAIAGSALLWAANDLVFVYAHGAGYLDDKAGGELISLSAGLVVNGVAMVITFLIGRTVRARREASAALAERALAAEAGRQAHAEQAVAEERRRIARELHDVVAHHVSVIGVMSTAARRMLHRDPAAADEALATIEQTSRSTLRELRRLLFVLRAEGALEPDPGLTPQPGLAGLPLLVEQVCEAGLPTALRTDGLPEDLDPGVGLTAYRIVQEALTNALKHAGPCRAEVRLTADGCRLTIEVFDTGRGPRTRTLTADGIAAPGHGLLGMRERVAVYGGHLRTGPRPGGGFRVYAVIPLEQIGPALAAALDTGVEVPR
ncbi:sensor histidine kinase [Catellatospora tritici]|uniref:sensor histidine kinase n=1 Tax=Catellatospora tritici TaxID=2851566 RepID=UPI0027E0B355|nr:sensor histidine kinase [Catellatospora tritici]